MPSFVYDLPSPQSVSLLSLLLVGLAWLGTIFLRPFIRTLVRRQSSTNDVVGYVLSTHGVCEPFLLETPP